MASARIQLLIGRLSPAIKTIASLLLAAIVAAAASECAAAREQSKQESEPVSDKRGDEPVPYTNATYGPPAKVRFSVEMITDTAGRQKGDGTGRSCWGFNQSNIVRHGENLYAMCWRDDTRLAVFRRAKEGKWEASPLLPGVPQNGNLLCDSKGRIHVITGLQASLHVLFDPPGQVKKFETRSVKGAGTRFGAAIRANDDILAVGAPNSSSLGWYVLEAKENFRQGAVMRMPTPTWRAYHFVAFRGESGYTYCLNLVHVPSIGYTYTYYYHMPQIGPATKEWKLTTISDTAASVKGKAPKANRSEDFLIDREGRLHMLYVHVAAGADRADRTKDVFYHAVGEGPEGPFKHYSLGNFRRGRIHQTSDGRFHYFLVPGRNDRRNELWYSTGENGKWDVISKPVQLKTPDKIDHIFLNNTRAGGTLKTFVDCYFTGQYPGKNGNIYYGRLELVE